MPCAMLSLRVSPWGCSGRLPRHPGQRQERQFTRWAQPRRHLHRERPLASMARRTKLLWSRRDVNADRANVGTGYASIVIAGGRIYTLGDRDKQGCIICLDEATGLARRPRDQRRVFEVCRCAADAGAGDRYFGCQRCDADAGLGRGPRLAWPRAGARRLARWLPRRAPTGAARARLARRLDAGGRRGLERPLRGGKRPLRCQRRTRPLRRALARAAAGGKPRAGRGVPRRRPRTRFTASFLSCAIACWRDGPDAGWPRHGAVRHGSMRR